MSEMTSGEILISTKVAQKLYCAYQYVTVESSQESDLYIRMLMPGHTHVDGIVDWTDQHRMTGCRKTPVASPAEVVAQAPPPFDSPSNSHNTVQGPKFVKLFIADNVTDFMIYCSERLRRNADVRHTRLSTTTITKAMRRIVVFKNRGIYLLIDNVDGEVDNPGPERRHAVHAYQTQPRPGLTAYNTVRTTRCQGSRAKI
ncbi:hypothetical protein HD554DRAFT_2039405 [Boletus coccyginus]|nr:hypothetical protein HD554DRAFT_2039405 [Boletus coccyginus]